MKATLKDRNNVTYWAHRGLWNKTASLMCPYLVHLNKVAWKFIQKVYERLLVVKREGKLLNNVTTYIHKHWPVTDSFIANTSALCLSFLIYRYLQISIISFFQYLFVFQYVIAYLLYIVYSALHFVYHSNHCNNGWFMNSIIGIYLIWLVVAHVTILALAFVSTHFYVFVFWYENTTDTVFLVHFVTVLLVEYYTLCI